METKTEENQGRDAAKQRSHGEYAPTERDFFNSTKVFRERTYMCLNEGQQKSKLHGLFGREM